MPFKKGQSGNPGGRPKKLDDVVELARSHCPEAIERLRDWMRSKNPKASVAACIALLNRGYGMPAQENTLIVEKRDAFDWSRDDLVAFLHDAAKGSERASKENGRGAKPDRVH